ncbi:MAG: hypothetical protein ACE5JK_04335 [Candidatus Omnitrophota bacterium]
MKHLVLRNVLGHNPRKHEVSIEEISDRPRNKISRKIITKYFVKERYDSESLDDLKGWIELDRKGEKPLNCHVLTTINTRTGESKVVCKALGVFYLVYGLTVYKIVFVNEIKIQVLEEKKVRK